MTETEKVMLLRTAMRPFVEEFKSTGFVPWRELVEAYNNTAPEPEEPEKPCAALEAAGVEVPE